YLARIELECQTTEGPYPQDERPPDVRDSFLPPAAESRESEPIRRPAPARTRAPRRAGLPARGFPPPRKGLRSAALRWLRRFSSREPRGPGRPDRQRREPT